jgi:citrate lyase subunit gamma (acyl carrier protein)
MQIMKKAKAGTDEKSDILIEVSPLSSGVEIDLRSPVEILYGEQIRRTIFDTVKKLGVVGVKIAAVDHSALDCVIAARTETAILRAAGKEGAE